ncbi:MAG: GFA family protein [Caulobacteraceae bacterium]
MTASDDILGQCLCGAVRFALTPPLGEITHCHCRSCRLSRGVAFVTWTSVPAERFAFLDGEGEVTWFRSSPPVRWGSCRVCGSAMFYIADEAGQPNAPRVGHVYVSLGSLTGEVPGLPIAHVSYEEHLAWIEDAHALPKYRGKTDERME